MMTLHIEPLGSEHLDAAVRLFASSYRGLRHTVPLLPARYQDPEGVRPMPAALSERQPMVAAIADGRLVGYLGGFEGVCESTASEAVL